jgi:hypothetical protein
MNIKKLFLESLARLYTTRHSLDTVEKLEEIV